MISLLFKLIQLPHAVSTSSKTPPSDFYIGDGFVANRHIVRHQASCEDVISSVAISWSYFWKEYILLVVRVVVKDFLVPVSGFHDGVGGIEVEVRAKVRSGLHPNVQLLVDFANDLYCVV